MRLGFWNRLALVATVLALLIAPLWIIMGINRDQFETRQATWHLCTEIAQSGPPEKLAAANEACWNERFSEYPYAPGWRDWFEFLAGTLIACAIVYALIWIFVSTAKWVWRGREQKNTNPE